jgi:hypothetical protein
MEVQFFVFFIALSIVFILYCFICINWIYYKRKGQKNHLEESTFEILGRLY